MKFKGTIIITDPCYITKNRDDWDICEYGENMENLGINTYITKDTEYGDWSCKTFSEYGDELGDFCADAGLVSVFLLDEVRKYNPDIDVWIEEHKWCCTKIEDFDGDIEITHREIEYDGDIENEVSVIGKGNINFFTTQTGY